MNGIGKIYTMTFMGASDARFELDDPNHLYTMAIGESYPLTIEAYGVSDCSHPPSPSRSSGGPYYSGTWHTLGRVSILNHTQAQASINPIHGSVYP